MQGKKLLEINPAKKGRYFTETIYLNLTNKNI